MAFFRATAEGSSKWCGIVQNRHSPDASAEEVSSRAYRSTHRPAKFSLSQMRSRLAILIRSCVTSVPRATVGPPGSPSTSQIMTDPRP
jgi:hypothetical protein